MTGRLLKREDGTTAPSRMLLGVLVVGTLTLSACGAPFGPPVDQPSPPAQATIEVRDAGNAYLTKPMVEGTELLCLSKGNYGSTTCNWELWNKKREAAK
jgi:hypothetical protein